MCDWNPIWVLAIVVFGIIAIRLPAIIYEIRRPPELFDREPPS